MTAGLTELGVRCPVCQSPPGSGCVGQSAAELDRGQGFHGARAIQAAAQSAATPPPVPPAREVRPRDAVGRPPWFPEQGTPQPLVQYSAEVMDEAHVGKRYAGYVRVTVDAGPRGVEGPHDNPAWSRRLEVSVSPTGRSARVWVDGAEIPAPK